MEKVRTGLSQELVRPPSSGSKETWMEVITHDPLMLQDAPYQYQDDIDIVISAVSGFSLALEFASLRLRSNKEVVLTAVTSSGDALPYVADVLKDDYDVASRALSNSNVAYKYISPRLQNDESLAMLTVTRNGLTLQLMNSKMKNNVDIVTTAVLSDPSSFRYAGSELQKNKSFIISLIKQNCEIGFWINASMQDDAEVVRYLILHTLEVFNLSCSERLKEDEFLVRLACQQNGSYLSCASERLQSRLDLKRLTSGFCFEKPHPLDLFSSPEKNNKKLMLPFMQQSPCAYLKLDDLKKDLEVALTAYLSTRYNRPWISKIQRSKLKSGVPAEYLGDIVSVYKDSIRQLHSLLTAVSSMSLLKVVIKQGSMTLASIFPSLPPQYTIDDFCSDFVKLFMPRTGIPFEFGQCILDYLHILDVKSIFYVLGNRLSHRFGERERSQRNHSEYADVFEDAKSVLGVTFQCR
jgi:hypothetical protein